MKRTNLMLDGQLLQDATVLLRLKTYSDVVNKALAETVKLVKIRSVSNLFGQEIWQGNLSEMREDREPTR